MKLSHAEFPKKWMNTNHTNAYEQLVKDVQALNMVNEFRRGMEPIRTGETGDVASHLLKGMENKGIFIKTQNNMRPKSSFRPDGSLSVLWKRQDAASTFYSVLLIGRYDDQGPL
jgi:hypothetical protein